MIKPESPKGLRVIEVINDLKDMGYDYEILDKNKNDVPVILRVHEWGLIWPTTGTFIRNGLMCKANYKALYFSLKSPIPEDEKTLDRRFRMMATGLSELADTTNNQEALKKFCNGILAKYKRQQI